MKENSFSIGAEPKSVLSLLSASEAEILLTLLSIKLLEPEVLPPALAFLAFLSAEPDLLPDESEASMSLLFLFLPFALERKLSENGMKSAS